MLFRRGDAAQAVRASSAVPGVFNPVAIAGREYVDGGLVAPVPVRQAREMGAEVVLAVDISADPQDLPSNGLLSVLPQDDGDHGPEHQPAGAGRGQRGGAARAGGCGQRRLRLAPAQHRCRAGRDAGGAAAPQGRAGQAARRSAVLDGGRIKKAPALRRGLKGSDEIEFRKGPEETTRKTGLGDQARLLRSATSLPVF